MRIYAFSDEASSLLDGQIAALKRNGLGKLRILIPQPSMSTWTGSNTCWRSPMCSSAGT